MGRRPSLRNVVQPPSDFYKNQPDSVNELNGYYYIHLHKINVGRMYEGADLNKGLSDNDIASKFAEYKNKNLADVVVNQYMQGLQASINQAGQYSNLIQNAFNTSMNGGQSIELLDTFHEVLEKGFEQAFDMSKVTTLLSEEYKSRWKGRANSVSALQDILNDSENREGLNFLDKQLEALARTVRLIKDPVLGASLEQALIALTNQKVYTSSRQIGSALLAELNKDKYKLDGSKIEQEEVKAAVRMLKDIGVFLENKDNKNLSADSLKGLIQNQFFSTMAEYFWMNAKSGVVNPIFKNISEVAFEQTGQDSNIEIQLTDPFTGAYLDNQYMKNSYFSENSQTSKASGKADGVAKNVHMDLASIFDDGAGYGELSIDLRISNKAYVTNHFGENAKLTDYNDVYGLGGGMNIGPGLDMLMASNINNKYLAYNVLCRNLSDNSFIHKKGFPKALRALQDALLTRNIVYLAAGRGKKDFSQLILLNGQIMSVWSIVKYVINNEVGISSSQLSKEEDDPTGHGVYLSLGKRDKIFAAMNEYDAVKRTKAVNSKIANKAMHLHIIPKKIVTYAKQVMSDQGNVNLTS